jgi:hypothetical protein
MLRIQRSSIGGVVFSMSGRIEAEDIVEMHRLLNLEAAEEGVTFDLQGITVLDRDAVKFLIRCESHSIKLENCPAYIREWMDTERGGSKRQTS